MQYHAHALVSNGVDVDLVGLEGTPLSQRITADLGGGSRHRCRPEPATRISHRIACLPNTSRYSIATARSMV